VKEIADAFGAEERGIDTVLDAESMRVSLDTAVPLAFIAAEILTNAFKHAFPGNRTGKVTITARREGDNGLLMITDNGVGLPKDARSIRPLGLTIVTKLVQQIGGTLEEPSPGGSTFRIVFPLGDEGETATASAGESPRLVQA
jgi:two-component sensor histidine kinase